MDYFLIILIVVIIIFYLQSNDSRTELFTSYIGQGAQSKVGFSKDGSVKKHHKNNKGYECEKKYLVMLKGENHIPQLVRYKDKKKVLYVTYCGEPLNHKNCPIDIEKQLYEIIGIMDKYEIKNTDFRSGNMTILNGTVYLVDWGMVRERKNGEDIIAEKRLYSMIQNLKSPKKRNSNVRISLIKN